MPKKSPKTRVNRTPASGKSVSPENQEAILRNEKMLTVKVMLEGILKLYMDMTMFQKFCSGPSEELSKQVVRVCNEDN